jgi:hypothetical protein
MAIASSTLCFQSSPPLQCVLVEKKFKCLASQHFELVRNVSGKLPDTPSFGVVVVSSSLTLHAHCSRCDDTDSSRLPRAGLSPNHNLNILIERGQKIHQAFDGEALQLVATKRGNLRLRHSWNLCARSTRPTGPGLLLLSDVKLLQLIDRRTKGKLDKFLYSWYATYLRNYFT